MRVIPVPCLSDNYAYLLVAPNSNQALVVDPSEVEPVQRELDLHQLTLAGILNTHHHWDHVGGNEALCARTADLRVCGHASDKGRIPGQTDFLEHEGTLEAAGLSFEILHIPGHTTGAVAYVTEDAVFTGDTLFAAGCGRLFEGTPAMMYSSLNQKLARLPDATRVFFGHEYTAKNLNFAASLEPDNAAIADKAARVAELRKRGEFSTPSTLADERATNPFMRCDSAALRQSLSERLGPDPSPVDVLAAARAAKDAF